MNERKAEERGKLLDSVLREHRIQNGELGKTMNVHNTTISRYRRGTSDISEERWAQISTMLYAHWGIKMWEQKITEPTLSPTKTPANGNFKTMREHFGTQQDLANIIQERTGMETTQTHISCLERDLVYPKLAPLKEACDRLFEEHGLSNIDKPSEPSTKTHTLDTYDLSNPEDRAYLLMRIEQLERINND